MREGRVSLTGKARKRCDVQTSKNYRAENEGEEGIAKRRVDPKSMHAEHVKTPKGEGGNLNSAGIGNRSRKGGKKP